MASRTMRVKRNCYNYYPCRVVSRDSRVARAIDRTNWFASTWRRMSILVIHSYSTRLLISSNEHHSARVAPRQHHATSTTLLDMGRPIKPVFTRRTLLAPSPPYPTRFTTSLSRLAVLPLHPPPTFFSPEL